MWHTMYQLTGLLFLTVTLAAPQRWIHDCSGHDNGKKAAYFLDNDPSGSSLVSLCIGENGILSSPIRTPTGGYGSITLNATDNLPVPVDSLQSQGSVLVSGNMLFTVNAGSNTLVMFRIDPADPYHPMMVGGPIDTMGEFPNSVTYSPRLQTACVLNGGSKAGISCFSVDPFRGLRQIGPFRPVSKSIFNETTPPTGPPKTASQIIFTPDSSALIAILKGDASGPSLPAHFLSYTITDGEVSTAAATITFADQSMAFGAVFMDDTRLLVSEPTYGASILDVSDPAQIIEEVHTAITGEMAACWAEYDEALNTGYIIDAGRPVVWTLDAISGAPTGMISATEDVGGVFDSAILGGRMYSLAKTNGLIVFDLVEKRQIQFLDLTSFGNRQGYDGMAVWP